MAFSLKTARRRHPVLFVAGLVTIVAVVLYIPLRVIDERTWPGVAQADTVEAYAGYLANHPLGAHADQAHRLMIAKLPFQIVTHANAHDIELSKLTRRFAPAFDTPNRQNSSPLHSVTTVTASGQTIEFDDNEFEIRTGALIFRPVQSNPKIETLKDPETGIQLHGFDAFIRIADRELPLESD